MTPLNAFSVALSCTIEQLWYFSVLWYELSYTEWPWGYLVLQCTCWEIQGRLKRCPRLNSFKKFLRNKAFLIGGSSSIQRGFFASKFVLKSISLYQPSDSLSFVCHRVEEPVLFKSQNSTTKHHRLPLLQFLVMIILIAKIMVRQDSVAIRKKVSVI